MLSLRIHHLGRKDCFSILTMPPQQRTLFTYYHKPMRLWLPHVAFVFHYQRVPKGFVYGSYYTRSLRVLFRNKPFTSITDPCFSSPTEDVNGVCCTDHSYDNRVFPSSRLLLGTILNLWWSSNHRLENFPLFKDKEWSDLTQKEVLKVKWRKTYNMAYFFPDSLKVVLPELGDFKDKIVKLPSQKLGR